VTASGTQFDADVVQAFLAALDRQQASDVYVASATK
jgi:hypothetical protein